MQAAKKSLFVVREDDEGCPGSATKVDAAGEPASPSKRKREEHEGDRCTRTRSESVSQEDAVPETVCV